MRQRSGASRETDQVAGISTECLGRPFPLEDTTLSPAEYLEYLHSSTLWSALSDDAMQALADVMRPAHFRAEDYIIRQGELGTHFYMLLSGQATVQVHATGDTVIPVATLKEGDCFGEMSLLSGDVTSADVVAVTPCTALTLGRDAFNGLVAAHPGFLREFIRMISRRLQATNAAIGFAQERAEELTKFLQDERAEQYGELAGKYQAHKELLRLVEAHAQQDTPLLILGEHGTGKELLARLIHFQEPRKDAPLLSADCTQIVETPWGDKLFGDYRPEGTERRESHAICYLALAEGGAILLKNIESLPLALQERLAGFLEGTADLPRYSVRIIATCTRSLADMAAAGQVCPALAAALAPHTITVPPLRERKRDLPELAYHFLHKHAQRLHKPVTAIDDEAMTRLASYDYRMANIQELEACIERAVILTPDTAVHAEEILLGPLATAQSSGLNLLRLPQAAVKLALRLFPGAVQMLVAAVFAFILYMCLIAPTRAGDNLGTLLVWGLWWPALTISFFLVGRLWCAVCPMALAGSTLQRFINLKWRIPGWLKAHDTLIVVAGFYLVMWVEEVTGMRHSALATGGLLLFILAGALLTSLTLPRRSWCRHLCPLGGFAGLCSAFSVVELRPTPDICTVKCTEHCCYKGYEAIDGCPMFNHLMFQGSNQHCVLCMNCVQSCPHNSPQLRMKITAGEAWVEPEERPEIGKAVVALLSLLIALIVLQMAEQHPGTLLANLLAQHHTLTVTALLALGALFSLLLVRLADRRLQRLSEEAIARFWQQAAAGGPTLAALAVYYQLAYIPGADRLSLNLTYLPPAGLLADVASFSLLTLIRMVVLLTGLGITTVSLWKLIKAQNA
ncbi:MAG: sigma 54-interacting transcriptional regulator [Armatimonadota bacterium]